MSKSMLQRVLEDEGLEVMAYSGRGMFGDQCVAVSVQGGLGELIAALLRADVDDDEREGLARCAEHIRTDTLGRGIVVYFPHVPFVSASSRRAS